MTEEQVQGKDAMNKALFSNLVIMLATSAMQQLGKLVNPMSGKTEVDLDGASATIDMIEMLQAKSQGNLDEEEQRLVRDTLHSLHLNFVESRNNTQAKPAETPAEPGQDKKTDTPPADAPKQDAPPADKDPGEEKKPKFHKRYD